MGAVRGLLLDESFLVTEDLSGNVHFQQGIEVLLRRLQYSKLHVGIAYGEDISSSKVAFLKSVAKLYSIESIALNISSPDTALNKIVLSWSGVAERYFYITSERHEYLFHALGIPTWTVIFKSSGDAKNYNKGELTFKNVEELPLILSQQNKMLLNGSSIMTIGYLMKPSRELDFAKRGAFPMYPTKNGLIFIPLTFGFPLESQIEEVDIVLHKATDEIVSMDPEHFCHPSRGISFSKGIQELQRCIADHQTCRVIDPFNNIYPLLDRLKIQQILLHLDDIKKESNCRIRAPQFLKLDTFQKPDLAERLSEAGLVFPIIVKPQVACGVSYAHDMAIVFQLEDFEDLKVPLPAIAQEYIDHGSSIYKFYIVGKKVFYATRKSTPNASVLMSSRKNGSKPIIFDSLKSLPTAGDGGDSGYGTSSEPSKQSLDVDLVTNAAHWLRKTLNLTILGFDVVIQEGTGDHAIVDVNYLPSFKEIPDEVAIPAFWDALKTAYETGKS